MGLWNTGLCEDCCVSTQPPGPFSCPWPIVMHGVEGVVRCWGQGALIKTSPPGVLPAVFEPDPRATQYVEPCFTDDYLPTREKLAPPEGTGSPICTPWWMNNLAGCRDFNPGTQPPFQTPTRDKATQWHAPIIGSTNTCNASMSGGSGVRTTGVDSGIWDFYHARGFTRWGYRLDTQTPPEGTYFDAIVEILGREPESLRVVGSFSWLVNVKTVNRNNFPGVATVEGNLQYLVGGSEEDVARAAMAGDLGGDPIPGTDFSGSVAFPASPCTGNASFNLFAAGGPIAIDFDVMALLQDTSLSDAIYWGAKIIPPFAAQTMEVEFYEAGGCPPPANSNTSGFGPCGTMRNHSVQGSITLQVT